MILKTANVSPRGVKRIFTRGDPSGKLFRDFFLIFQKITNDQSKYFLLYVRNYGL